MKKVLEINACHECPFYVHGRGGNCHNQEGTGEYLKYIGPNTVLPDWCPLPSVEEYKATQK